MFGALGIGLRGLSDSSFFLLKCIASLTVVVYYRARVVSSREDSSDKLSELVFRAAHYQRSLPPAEEFPNTRHYHLAQWVHLATGPAQSVSSTYFVDHWRLIGC